MDHPEGAGTRRGKPGARLWGAAALLLACVGCVSCDRAPGGVHGGGGSGDPSSAADDLFVERFREAQQLFGAGKDARAEAIFRDLLKQYPDAAAVHHALAWIEWFRGHRDAAVAGFCEAARLAPEDGAVRRDAGLRLVEVGRDAEALPHLEAARKLLDTDGETLCALGRALAANGRPAEAERTFRDALAIDGNSVDARTLLARQIVARDPAEAFALLEHVALNWPDVVLVRAQALERLSRWDEAAAANARAAESVLPGAAGIPLLRDAAEALVRNGDEVRAAAVAQAWSDREKAAGPASFRSSICLAVARAGAGDPAAALTALDGTTVPAGASPQLRAHFALVRAHLLLEAGRADEARAELAAVAGLPAADAPFERAVARRAVSGAPATELAAIARPEPSRANDVLWAEWLRARLAGDSAGASAARTSALASTSPPGEHPGALLRGVR